VENAGNKGVPGVPLASDISDGLLNVLYIHNLDFASLSSAAKSITDSGFEGLTTLYYDPITVIMEQHR